MSSTVARAYPAQTAAGPDLATLFVSLELSKSKWLATVLSPGGDKMARHVVAAGDWNALLGLLLELCGNLGDAVIRRRSALACW